MKLSPGSLLILLVLSAAEFAAWQSSVRVGVGVSCVFSAVVLMWVLTARHSEKLETSAKDN